MNENGSIEASNFVIKVFNDIDSFQREIWINVELLDLFKRNMPNNIICQVCYKEELLSIVYEPVGKCLENMKLTKKQVNQIFDAVESLHIRGVIHRDLSPSHFCVHKVSFTQFNLIFEGCCSIQFSLFEFEILQDFWCLK